MADLATLQTELTNIDAALADFAKTGIVRYTMPDGRSVDKDIEALRAYRASIQSQIHTKTASSPFSYAVPRRAT